MLKICVITGSRAEYGLLKNLLKEIQAHPQMELQLVVTGTHLVKEFGYTVAEIEKEFHVARKVDIHLQEKSREEGMGKPFARAILGMTSTFEELSPDWVVITADRFEMLAATLCACFQNIPIAHISGGEVSGTVDDTFRHAISRFAHLHFPPTERSAERLRKMGEEPKRIFMAGTVGVSFDEEPIAEPEAIERVVGISPLQSFLLVVQHPDTLEPKEAGLQMEQTLKAVERTHLPAVLGYPNVDPGSKLIANVIKTYEGKPFLKIFTTLPRDIYLGLLRHASAIVGNSSSGIWEAPFFWTPAVNIGNRQAGRERGANVFDVKPDTEEIFNAIQKILNDPSLRERLKAGQNPYAGKGAEKKIVEALAATKVTPEFLLKQLNF